MDVVRFYFSFRSPFAWFAFHLAPRALRDLPVELQRIPIYPPPDFPNDPSAVPAKLEYIARHDLPRIAEGYGFKIARLAQLDVDWLPPHAMWLYASDRGAGERFGAEVYAARFSRGEDLTRPEVYAAAARAAGLDAEATLAAGADPALHARVRDGIEEGRREHGVFGVPFFVFRGERFWGHDRIGWLVRSIARAHGLAVPPPELQA